VGMHIAPKLFLSSLLLFIALLIPINRSFLSHNHHFCLQHITGQMPYHPQWDTPPLSIEEQTRLFDQKYTYLSKGRQSFVFMSADGKFVLKLLSIPPHMRPFFWISHPTTLHFRSQHRKDKADYLDHKLFTTCDSVHLAFTELKEETDLVWIHLNPNGAWKRKVEIIDALGSVYPISLDKHIFIVQKRGSHIFPTLSDMIQQGRIEEAKGLIDSVIELIVSRCKKGIADHDPILRKNYGWNGKRAIHFDVGRFSKKASFKDRATHKGEIEQITHSLAAFLAEQDPNLLSYYQEKLSMF
jgi:hypothetical protein